MLPEGDPTHRWTDASPASPGYYRHRHGRDEAPDLLEVGLVGGVVCARKAGTGSWVPVEYMGGWWLGPVLPPWQRLTDDPVWRIRKS